MTQNAINLPIPVEVTNGGTEVATLTDHGVLLGSGTGAITALAEAATGTVLTGVTAADAAFSGTPTVTSISFGDEALAYYAEGTWTPVLTFGGGSTGITYTTQTGSYTRIGNIIWLFMNLTLSNKGSSSGAAVISGLPFTSTADGYEGIIERISNLNLTANYYTVCLENAGSSTTVSVVQNGDNVGASGLTDAAFANNTSLIANFMYNI